MQSTSVRAVVQHYFTVAQLLPSQRKPYTRFLRSASRLLTRTNGSVEFANVIIDQAAETFKRLNRSWTLETVVKHAVWLRESLAAPHDQAVKVDRLEGISELLAARFSTRRNLPEESRGNHDDDGGAAKSVE